MATLFDTRQRTNGAPASHAEDMFSFLERVDQPYWAAVRDLLDEWFAELPPAEQGELRNRFHTGRYGEILSALWQLYLHALLVRSGLAVSVHPTLSDNGRKPDFLACEASGEGFYLEAAVVVEPDHEAARRRVLGAIFDQINLVPSPLFWLRVYLDDEGEQPPPASRLRPFLTEWLATLDYEHAVALAHAKRWDDLESATWESGGWKVRFMALPKVPPARGQTIGMYPVEGGIFDVRADVLPTLKKKASRYGKLDRPYVIAVLCDNVVSNDRDIEAALFGRMTVNFARAAGHTAYWGAHRKNDGLWTPERGTRVSAVVTATEFKPHTIARVVPRLWQNPWAAHPLHVELPWTAHASPTETESPLIVDPAEPPHEVLELAADWPPGEPFPGE